MGGALRPTRRTVLTAAAATGAAGVLSACGGDGSSDTASGADATTAAPETTTATPTTSPTQQTQSPATSAEALAKVSDVAVGAGVVNDSAKVVVTQPTQGQFKGFTAVCTHQGCLVDRVQNNVIFCPCHGSQYSAEDGSVISPPAPAPLSAVAVKVEGDSIVRA